MNGWREYLLKALVVFGLLVMLALGFYLDVLLTKWKVSL